jgi:hypothetical protein
MIRVALHSEDRALQPLLSSALGKDFHIALEPSVENLSRMSAKSACDVVLFDLNPSPQWLEKHLPEIRLLIDSGVPSVVMADDSLRTTAFELVRLGELSPPALHS